MLGQLCTHARVIQSCYLLFDLIPDDSAQQRQLGAMHLVRAYAVITSGQAGA